VVVDHLRGHPAAVELLESLVDRGEEAVASEVVRFELLAGVRSRELRTLEAFFSALAWVPVSEEVAREAGRFARRYRRGHAGIGAADYLIGATSVVLRADLLTTNVRHFPMFAGLRAPY